MTQRAPAPPRLPLVDAPQDALARELLEHLAKKGRVLNLHRMMAHAPGLMKASGDMALAFREKTELARNVAELAILRTAQVTDCEYVWSRHLSLARACGVSEQQISELARWPDSQAFTPAEKAALGFAEKAAVRTPVPDAVFAALQAHFTPRQIVELAMLIGFYVSTVILIDTLAVPAERS